MLMNKRKFRMMGWAVAAVLAMTPFLHGCAAGDTNTDANQNEGSGQETSQMEPSTSQTETVRYGQVMAVNGDEVTVDLGELENAQDGSGAKTFVADEDEITFNKGNVVVMDESGAVADDPTFAADDVLVMRGAGLGSDFVPEKIEILDITENGLGTDK